MLFVTQNTTAFVSSTKITCSAAARQTRDADQNRRREELQRRIEETRQKLQNVRYPLFPFIRRPIFLKYFHLFLHFSDYSFCDVTQTDNEMTLTVALMTVTVATVTLLQ